MSTDFEISAGLTFGDWLRQEIEANAVIERNGFLPDRVRRVAARLQSDRPESARLIVEVVWSRTFTAYTAPGRYIYFSRRLLERCPDDETVAFVIAHEIAHHDLGHLDLFKGRFGRRAAQLDAGMLMVLFFRHLQKRVYSPEWELAADQRAIELCVSSGYNGPSCLRLFDVLQKWFEYHLDFDGVYGLDRDSDQELSPEASLLTKARIWMYQRERGYLPIQDRRAVARSHMERYVLPGHASAPA